MNERLSAKCLCGSLKFSAMPKQMNAKACHCAMCRQWSGGVFMAVECENSVEFENDEMLGRFQSSKWGERLFCKKCGSSIIWQTRDGNHQNVSLQAFENPAAFNFSAQVFIDCKPDNYSFAENTHNMSEAEIIAMFSPSPKNGSNGEGSNG